jgi:chromosome segregation ATPase
MNKPNGSKKLRHVAIGTAIIILLLTTLLIIYVMTGNYINKEISLREEKIEDLNRQVSSLQELLEQNKPQISELNKQITHLTDTSDALELENEKLNELVHTKQYQLMLSWHEIYVLRNQTEKLENQITELETQIEDLQSTTIPTGVP